MKYEIWMVEDEKVVRSEELGVFDLFGNWRLLYGIRFQRVEGRGQRAESLGFLEFRFWNLDYGA